MVALFNTMKNIVAERLAAARARLAEYKESLSPAEPEAPAATKEAE